LERVVLDGCRWFEWADGRWAERDGRGFGGYGGTIGFKAGGRGGWGSPNRFGSRGRGWLRRQTGWGRGD